MLERSIIWAALKSASACESSHRGIIPISKSILMREDVENLEQQTLGSADVGTPCLASLTESAMLSTRGGFTAGGWEGGGEGKTALETGYVPLLHLLPRTFGRKHLPPYTHSNTQAHNRSRPLVHTEEVNPVSEDKRFPRRRGSRWG